MVMDQQSAKSIMLGIPLFELIVRDLDQSMSRRGVLEMQDLLLDLVLAKSGKNGYPYVVIYATDNKAATSGISSSPEQPHNQVVLTLQYQ